jgi:hypothetical protein
VMLVRAREMLKVYWARNNKGAACRMATDMKDTQVIKGRVSTRVTC